MNLLIIRCINLTSFNVPWRQKSDLHFLREMLMAERLQKKVSYKLEISVLCKWLLQICWTLLEFQYGAHLVWTLHISACVINQKYFNALKEREKVLPRELNRGEFIMILHIFKVRGFKNINSAKYCIWWIMTTSADLKLWKTSEKISRH